MKDKFKTLEDGMIMRKIAPISKDAIIELDEEYEDEESESEEEANLPDEPREAPQMNAEESDLAETSTQPSEAPTDTQAPSESN